MGHVFPRGWKLRAAIFVGIVVVCSVLAGTVQAAATTSASGQTTCTAPNPDPNTPGGCEYTMSGTSVATFQGQFNNPTVVVEDPTDPGNPNGNCPQQTPADEADTLCGHYHLNVGTATGTITVTINFDSSSVDLDLC